MRFCMYLLWELDYKKKLSTEELMLFLKIYFILLIWVCQVLIVTSGIFDAACKIFICSVWNLVPWPGIELWPPALGAWSFRQWTTTKVSKWHFWTVVLEKTLESTLDCKEIQPVHPKGSQSWVFIGRSDVEAEAPILWPPDSKNWLLGKDPDAGNNWRQEEKGTIEDEMIEWHYWLNRHDFE